MASRIFNGSSTAEEVAAHFAARARGLRVVVTGANTGLGWETARVLAHHGAAVTLAARSEAKGQAAVEQILARHPGASVQFMQLDLSSLAGVDAFADAYLATGRGLDVLVNNAGVMALPYSKTADGFEILFGVNHVAHYRLTRRLEGLLAQSGKERGEASRVVVLSSFGHYIFAPSNGILFDDLDGARSYQIWRRYGHSKLANVLFAYELNRRSAAEGKPVVAVSLHPGMINDTDLTRHTDMKSMWTSLAMMGQTNYWAAREGLAEKEKT
ncbi:hypothetical protein HK405_011939, partial [Cladochytrium tenue]